MPNQRDDEQHEDGIADGGRRSPTRLTTEGGDDDHHGARFRDGDDDDGETWTNRPTSVKEGAPEASEEDLLEEEEAPPVTKKAIQNGRDVLCEELPSRAQRAKARLKPHLTCTLGLEITSSGERFIFDWKGEEPSVVPTSQGVSLSDASGGATVVDSIISLTEQNLMAIRSGDLNPQVAMLAEKIKVKGKIGPAVYLFNLIAPRFQQ